MIREEKLPENILSKISGLVKNLGKEEDLEAFLLYGSAARGNLKPLSDLDFAILLNNKFIEKKTFRRELDYRMLIADYLGTDEFDLILLNNAPLRFAYSVLKEGKILHCNNQTSLINFTEKINKYYLDFQFYKTEFNKVFQQILDENYG